MQVAELGPRLAAELVQSIACVAVCGEARDRIRELTERRRALLCVEVIVEDVNQFLRGWAAYFRYGNSARHFDKIMGYARMRLAGFLAKKHRRPRGSAGR